MCGRRRARWIIIVLDAAVLASPLSPRNRRRRGRRRNYSFGDLEATQWTLVVGLEPAIYAVGVETVFAAVERPNFNSLLEIHQTDRAHLPVLVLGALHSLVQVLGRGRVLLYHVLAQSHVQASHAHQLQQSIELRVDAQPVRMPVQAVAVGERQF